MSNARLLNALERALTIALEAVWEAQGGPETEAVTEAQPPAPAPAPPPAVEPPPAAAQAPQPSPQMALVPPPERDATDLIGEWRLPCRKATPADVQRIIQKWEHSTDSPLAKFEALMLEFGFESTTILMILQGRHATGYRAATNAPASVPRKTRRHLKPTDAEMLRDDWRRLKTPTHTDLVRIALRYSLSVAVARQILTGAHHLYRENGVAS